MSYYFSKRINSTFADAVERVTEELKKEGFGILTEIDVKATLKKKLDVDFHPYKILGACNPSFAYKALQAEKVEIAAVDPIASMQAVDNPALGGIAGEVQAKLKKVIVSL
ncbi:MAG: DUF302 domain-containing protein [Deltaproteobacteria bacterium]|nr:DUF302 domain-containing protein [Deltaproteobacteria bacterium]